MSKELRDLVAAIQQQQTEFDNVEVKAAHGGTPKKLYDSLSALANRPGGGIILFGLNELQAFKVVGVGDVQRLQEDISNWAASEMEPPVRFETTIGEIDQETVVAIEVFETPPKQKPCYYKRQGLQGGAYIRSGGTDRKMSDYEIFGYVSSRGQPAEDEEIIHSATLDDLDDNLLDRYFEGLRQARPRASFLNSPQNELLVRLHIAARDGEVLRPTLAGLLSFGNYPQEFFPQLRITFLQYYGTTDQEKTPQGARFLDNQQFEGPILAMLDETERYVLGAMRKSSLIDGVFRRDIPEYPQEALREAIANAIAHRDYSTYARGSYIQIRMFADRLEVHSPGGLFGNVTVDNLEEEHSTRNARLMRILEDLHIVENRGSGIKSMLESMRRANLEPPKFADRRSSFLLTFRNHTMMNPSAIKWLNQFANLPLNDRQRLGLVYLRQQDRITNSDYRRLNRVEAMTAGQELRGLVQSGLIDQQGIGRGTFYMLKVPREFAEELALQTSEEKIIAYVRQKGSITNAACRELLSVNENQAYYILKKLLSGGYLKGEGVGKGRRYVLS